MNTFGEFEYHVRGYECGPDGVASLASVLNYLQESAGLQAEESGFSKRDFNAAGEDVSWVITRLHLKMLRYPRWHERIRVVTWPCGGRRVFAERDFEVFAGDEKIGMATSEWVLLDLAKRKVVDIPQNVYDAANDERPRALGEHHVFSRMRWTCREVGDDAVCLRARRGEIDINGHVNNVRYVEWLMEAVPAEVGAVREFEIVFKSETMAGDAVVAEAAETEPGVFAARAASSDGRDHVIARIAFGGSAAIVTGS